VYFPVRLNGSSLLIISSLALLAGVMGIIRRSFVRLYLSAFLWIPVLTLSTIFTPKITRYVYITLPILFILGALGAGDVLWLLRKVLTPLRATWAESQLVRKLVALTILPGFLWIAFSITGGVRDYGLVVDRLTGSPTARKHIDYDYTVGKIKNQILPTDTVVTLCPPDLAAFYAGRSPDFIIATGRDKLLYLMERNGQPVDTTYGSPVIFTAASLQTIIQNHHRVWLITDQGPYLNGVTASISKLILSNFDEVSEGTGAAVYFRGE
jgi:hypothetical protein